MLTETSLMSHWQVGKSLIHKFWISVTEEELEKTRGSLSAIITLIQQKYGHSREVIMGILEDLANEADSTNNVGSKLTNAFHQPR